MQTSRMGTSDDVAERKFSEQIMLKGQKMKEKTDFVHQVFQVPISECVIQGQNY